MPALFQVMGDDTKVTHQFGMPFTVISVVDGQKGVRECLPLYFVNCYNCGFNPCGGHATTAQNAANIVQAAPVGNTIDRA